MCLVHGRDIINLEKRKHTFHIVRPNFSLFSRVIFKYSFNIFHYFIKKLMMRVIWDNTTLMGAICKGSDKKQCTLLDNERYN